MKGKNVALSIENHVSICHKKKENPKISHSELAQWAQEEFKLFKAPSPSTISKVLKRGNKDSFQQTEIKDRKRTRMGKWPEMDKAVLCWIRAAQKNKEPVHWNLIKTKAIFHAAKIGIPNFQASHGWMEKFAKRHGINMSQLAQQTIPPTDATTTTTTTTATTTTTTTTTATTTTNNNNNPL